MIFSELKKKVIDAGLCTHCGTCVGLDDKIAFVESKKGPVPAISDEDHEIDKAIWEACPGKGLNYAELNKVVFGKTPQNWLIGNCRKTWVGFSKDPEIRQRGASGGVITQLLVYLLEKKFIKGAIVLKQGIPKPWLAEPIIATTRKEIIDCSQSVYAPIPVNTILKSISEFEGKVAYVGLPDQLASIRKLQSMGHHSVMNIVYLIGPYVGINMYSSAVLKFARSNGIKNADDIKEVKYRDGEWPGFLRITDKSGHSVKAEKFYYNYLLPFYITNSTLYSIDFANDFTDISVGDAWSPVYEKQGKGFAVIVARNKKAQDLLEKMKEENRLSLDEKTLEEILNMHGHMFDFKKRGAFVRMSFRKLFGKKIPDYGIWPQQLGLLRYLVEIFIYGVILLCSNNIARALLGLIPVKLIGRFFNFSRKSWKNISKPTKRKGLQNQQYSILSENKQ